jgi:hypothetical protein
VEEEEEGEESKHVKRNEALEKFFATLVGFYGLGSNQNSFSKWCLQYSPIPVVIVRPPEKG